MKRYVIEFANDIIKVAQGVKCPAAIQRADWIVHLCRFGYITDFEAVKELTKITFDKKEGNDD